MKYVLATAAVFIFLLTSRDQKRGACERTTIYSFYKVNDPSIHPFSATRNLEHTHNQSVTADNIETAISLPHITGEPAAFPGGLGAQDGGEGDPGANLLQGTHTLTHTQTLTQDYG